MTPPKSSKEEGADGKKPLLKRPSFMNKLSSMMPTIPLRRPNPKTRPLSEPDLSKLSDRSIRRGSCQDEEPLLPPSIDIPTLSDEVCPYDPKIYYSFPSIERSRLGILCGLASPSHSRGNVQSAGSGRDSRGSITHACSSGKGRPCVHIGFADKHPRSPRYPTLPTVVETGIARVKSADTIRRYQPSTSAALFPGHAAVSGWTAPSRPPTRHGPVPESERERRRPSLPTILISPFSNASRRKDSPSPKLHHVHLAPGDHGKYAYVHKHEVRQHLTMTTQTRERGVVQFAVPVSSAPAQETHGPLHTSTQHPDPRGYGQDHPSTVFYQRSSSRGHGATSRRPSLPAPLNIQTNIGAGKRKQKADAVTGPPQRHTDRESMLLRHNLTSLRRASLPRIAGDTSPRSPFDHVPPHSPLHSSPLTLVETIQASGTVTFSGADVETPVSVELQLGASDVYRMRAIIPARTADPNTQPAPAESGDSSAKTTISAETPATTSTIIGGRKVELRGGGTVHDTSSTHAIPRLRGGSGGGTIFRTLEPKEKLKGFVAWTAGVRRRGVTVEEWRRMKPKRRRGGILGLIMHGKMAGMPYEDVDKGVEEKSGGDVEGGGNGHGAGEAAEAFEAAAEGGEVDSAGTAAAEEGSG